MPGLMVLEYADSTWRVMEFIPDLNAIEHLWDIVFRSIRRHQVAPRTLQELNDALKDLGGRTKRHHPSSQLEHAPMLVSMHTSTWGPRAILKLFEKMDEPATLFFHFDFWGVY